MHGHVCVCVLGDYTEEDESEQMSGIKEPLKFHLPFGYKIYMGKCGLKTRGRKILICSY